MDIKTLCARYAQKDRQERLVELFREFDRVLVTSSFGTSSAILLHMIHRIRPGHPIHFIDTRYHFEETLAYAETLKKQWNLNVVPVRPKQNENRFTSMDYTWSYDPDLCCYVNKVLPMEHLKRTHQVWISGLLAGSTANRRNLQPFRHDGDILRFYPFFDMDEQAAEWYRIINELPRHPLEAQGYGSVGCEQCTHKGEGRSGRWSGREKTECGLHVTIKKDDVK